MEECFEFDLSYLGHQHNQEADNIQNVDMRYLAHRISDSNELIQTLKSLQNENVVLKKRLCELKQSANDIQSLYSEERIRANDLKATNVTISDELSETRKQVIALESELVQKNLYYSQLGEEWKQAIETEKKNYADLNQEFRLARDKYQEGTKLATKKNILAVKSELFCNSCLNTKDVAHRNATKEQIISKTQISRGTQYKYSSTTRSTCTSAFIKKRNVGTNFPEISPIPIEHILNETIYDVPCPLSPIVGTPSINHNVAVQTQLEISTSTVGTCTDYCNIRNNFGILQESSMKLEKDSTELKGKPTPQLSDLWELLGQTIFALINSREGSHHSSSAEIRQNIESFTNRFSMLEKDKQTNLKNDSESEETRNRLSNEGYQNPPNCAVRFENSSTDHSNVASKVSSTVASYLSNSQENALTESNSAIAESQLLAIKKEFEVLDQKCMVISPIRENNITKKEKRNTYNAEQIEYQCFKAIEASQKPEGPMLKRKRKSKNTRKRRLKAKSKGDKIKELIINSKDTIHSNWSSAAPESFKSDFYLNPVAIGNKVTDSRLVTERSLLLDAEKSDESTDSTQKRKHCNKSSDQSNIEVPTDARSILEINGQSDFKIETDCDVSDDECDFYGFSSDETSTGELKPPEFSNDDSPKSPTESADRSEDCKPIGIPLERDTDYDSPQSPKGELSNTNAAPKLIPVDRIGYFEGDSQNYCMRTSVLRRLISNITPSKQRLKQNVSQTTNQGRLKWILRKIVEQYLTLAENNLECQKFAKRIIRRTGDQVSLISNVIFEVIEDTDEEISNEFTPPAPIMTQSHRKTLLLVKMLDTLVNDFEKTFVFGLDRRIFSLKSDKIELKAVVNLLVLYIGLIDISNESTNPARLVMYKSLYYYAKMSYPLVYYLLVTYPAMLPKKQDWDMVKCNPLVNTLLSILNSQKYDMENTDLKHREVFHILRLYYEYDPVKPSREELVDDLISRIKSNNIRDVNYCFALLCKRNGIEWSSTYVIDDKLIPLLKTFMNQLGTVDIYDDQVACILDCLSAILKPFPISYDVHKFRQIFVKVLHASDRQIIQEAAVLSMLRISRFGYVECFNQIYWWNPLYKISPVLRLSIQSFLNRSSFKRLKQFETRMLR